MQPRRNTTTRDRRPHNSTYQDLSRALKRKASRAGWPCWICKKPIDYTLDWKHPMSYTYDHITSIATGGDPRGPGRPAHRSCNSRRGKDAATPETIASTNTSINWLAGPY